ncbi:MAG: type VI secretion system-associated FHA domain protein TagH [Woeseiaceae bacterium]|nr:type VI secretion system-associated FHA domain protein TagH [Woeseiaceae bacterium]
MTCQLEIISEHRDIVGDDAVRVFREEGGTIGRSLQNDWILPDPDRYISGRHATIDFKGGIYYLVDTSSNGVYINGDCEPVGKGNVRRLFNGDMLRLGDFEIAVSIDHGESIIVPLDGPDSPVEENVAPLVAEDSIATGVALLDEEEITGDDEFQSALFGAAADTGIVERAVQTVAAQDLEEMIEAPQHSVPRELAEADLVATDLIDSFLDGLGINRAELHPSVDLGQVMQNAGEVLREFVNGTTALLESRANMKNAFRLDQTTVLPRHNNPLKLSANARDSIMQLLVGKEGEYLGPRDAVREVCRDLLFHQDAMLDGMNDAFNEFADKFEPQELAETFDHNLGSNFLLRWRNKAKYWPMYCDLYPIITEKGSGRFPQMYAEEFVAAYERQIAEYKRLGTGEEHLKETVIMNESDLVTDPAVSDMAQDDQVGDGTIDLNESAKLVLQELEEAGDVALEQIDEGNDLKETVALEGVSLDDLPDEEPDRAEG